MNLMKHLIFSQKLIIAGFIGRIFDHFSEVNETLRVDKPIVALDMDAKNRVVVLEAMSYNLHLSVPEPVVLNVDVDQ